MRAAPTPPEPKRMISYAQNAEDVVLGRVFGPLADGFYIDVGANHPVTDSVTKHFYDLGWHGINVEPVRVLHEMLSEQRPRDINLCVGVSDAPGTLEFAEVRSNHGLSTFHETLDARHSDSGHDVVKRAVPITTLADICREHVTREIDFLKVDVEGYEAQVFRGHDWEHFRPKVIVAEDNFATDWSGLVESHGYTQMLHDGLNRFFMRNDLIPELGHLLDRPAVIAIDGYDPWLYVQQLDALQRKRLIHRFASSRVGQWLSPLGRTAAGQWVRRTLHF
ncbi:MAG: FkbM family methyltransferase [Actinobacteria bacterium]|nr:FkbM family methyltransferase [Actinomycetota bacterium]